MKKNILITGAKGQLASEFRALPKSGQFEYLFADRLCLDISNKSAIDAFFENNRLYAVVNCAAYTNVDKAEEEPDLAFEINAKACEYLVEACNNHHVALIHISTDYVFSGEGNVPLTEDIDTNPLGIYGKSKRLGEITIVEKSKNYIIIRTSWVYSSFGKNFFKTILRLIDDKDEIKVVYDQVGSPTYAKDLAQAIDYIIESNQINKDGIYHFSNEGVCSWFDFANEIASKKNNKKCKIIPCLSNEFVSKVKRPHYSVLAKNKFKKTFGYSIPYWKDSLNDCFAVLEENKTL